MGVPETDPLSQLSLPPGFRFYPTDEELLVQYLCRKVAGQQFSLQIIGEIDLYKFDPWVLPSKAMFGEKEWYFFSPRDRKYPNGSRPNRVAGSGYWKATGTDKVITTEGRKVGIKKALVFYVGKATKGTKTNWIMHEYRLIEPSRKHGSSKLDEWVLCRIYKKNSSGQKPILSMNSQEQSASSSSSHLDDVLESLPGIDHQFFNLPRINSLKTLQNDDKINLQNLGSRNFDWATLAGLSSVAELGGGGGAQTTQGQNQGTVTASHSIANNNNLYNNNDMYVPSMSGVYHAGNQQVPKLEEEVQSEVRGSTVKNSFFYHQNSTGFPQNMSNSVDSFGYRYPTQQPGFGMFRR